jgi:hypothetical protein
MDTSRHIVVGIRSQSVLVFALVALWWFSAIFRDSLFGFQSVLWLGVGFLFPFIAAIFAVILFVSYRRAGRPHRWLVRLSLLAAASPWILFLVMFLSAV